MLVTVTHDRRVTEVRRVVGRLEAGNEVGVGGTVLALTFVVEVGRQHQSSRDLAELRTQNGATWRVLASLTVHVSLAIVDVALTRDGLRRLHVVSSDHAHEDASLLTVRDSLRHLGSHRVLEAEECDERETALDGGTLADALLFLCGVGDHLVPVLRRIEVAVGEREHTQRLLCHRVDAVLHDATTRTLAGHLSLDLLEVTGELLDSRLAVLETVAESDDHFGRSLDVESELAVGESEQAGRSFSGRVEGEELDDSSGLSVVLLELGVLVAHLEIVDTEQTRPLEHGYLYRRSDAHLATVLCDR